MSRSQFSSRGPSRRPVDSGLSGRWLALQAIEGFHKRGAFAARVLEDYFASGKVDPRERRFATELAHETLRRRSTIDAILSAFIDRPPEAINPVVWTILQLGCCQLLCLIRIPPHAAIHETVELCERMGRGRAKGFVNGILRSLSREMRLTSLADDDQTGWQTALNDTRVLPVLTWENGILQYRLATFIRQILRGGDATDHLARRVSLPDGLLRRWQVQFPQSSAMDWLKLGLYFTTQGKFAVRVNPLRTTRDQLLAALHAREIQAAPGTLPEAICQLDSLQFHDMPEFQQGWFSVQDESAMSAVDLLSPVAGESILDLCAAPGGKTCHLAERMQNTGSIIACDISEERLQDVRSSADRLGLTNIATQLIGADGSDVPAGPFDAALVDVPCSNTGVLGKRPEARWRLSPESFAELIPLQRRLLRQAVDCVRPGGRIVYSTCSIDREENDAVVQWLLGENAGCELVHAQSHWPSQPSDGAYQALLRKKL